MNYHSYDKPRPCPYCGTPCHADFVDIGIGMEQCGPYHCESCGATEIGPVDLKTRTPTPEERDKGWYAPGSPPGDSVNVVNGKVVTAEQMRVVYRELYPFSATEEGKKWIREHNPYTDPLPAGVHRRQI